MLSDKIKLLLSAYVDGALSADDAEMAQRLLRESPEAGLFVRKLAENMLRVKGLPRKTLSEAFTGHVVAALPVAVPVASVPPVSVPTVAMETPPAFESFDGDLVTKPKLRRAMPAWMVGGIAASLVGAAALGGVLWMQSQLGDNRNLLPRGQVAGAKQPAKIDTPNPVEDLVADMVRGAAERYGETKPEVVVAPKSPTPSFAFRDLHKQDSLDYLKWELAHSPTTGVHLDVTVKYNARSLNRIIESFHKQGVQLVVTSPAEASLAKKLPLLVYAENVQADRLALALKELSEIDIQGTKKEASTFDAVRVSPDSADDHDRIAKSLGIDARQLKSPMSPVPQVSAVGVVLPADLPTNPGSAREIRGFLAGRGPVRIGTLQVFIHLQPTEK